MRRTARSALIVLFLVIVRPSLTAACSLVGDYLPRPIQCAESVALNTVIDGAALFPGDREQADAFERRLRAEAIRKLGENRLAVDPEGRGLRFEIRETSDGRALIAVYSRSPESVDLVLDAEEVERQPNVATENISAGVWRTPHLLLQVALDLFGRSIANNWQSDCDPPRTLSANGKYAFELPPSHPEARERYLSSIVEGAGLEPSDPRPAGSLLAFSDDGEEERLSTFRLADEMLPERFLVSDDGQFVVAFNLQERASGGAGENTLIYRADGSRVARLTLDDLLTSGDLETLHDSVVVSDCGSPPSRLSASVDDGRDLLILTLKQSTIPHEIAIDLETGTLLAPRRNLLPQHMRATVDSGPSTSLLSPVWNPPVCVEGIAASEAKSAFAPEPDREPSGSLYAHSIERPLPTFTEIAKRARLRGPVEVEVLVSETGGVLCARITQLSMGLDKSAEAAALRWRFQPFVEEGKPVRAIGRFSFHFGWTDSSGGL